MQRDRLHNSANFLWTAFKCTITHRQIKCQYYDLTEKGNIRWPIFNLTGMTDIKAIGWYHLRQGFAKYRAQEILHFPEWNVLDRVMYLCGYIPPIKEHSVEFNEIK